MTAPTFTVTRHFDAPPALVWRCWTDPDLVGRWYGPGMETEVHRFDPTQGGLWLHEMKMGEQSMYQRMEYLEFSSPNKLVMLMSTTDAEWNVVANPMMKDWPRVLLTTVSFAEDGGGTLMTLEWTPHEASDAENAAFAAAMASLDQGWGKGMDVIAEILVELGCVGHVSCGFGLLRWVEREQCCRSLQSNQPSAWPLQARGGICCVCPEVLALFKKYGGTLLVLRQTTAILGAIVLLGSTGGGIGPARPI